MKSIKRTYIIFIVLMLVALAVFIVCYGSIKFNIALKDNYSSQELSAYNDLLDLFRSSFENGKADLLKVVLIFWGIIFISGLTFITVVYHFLIKPVREMQDFASEIAKGNLDVNLPIHKHNIFGNFTESFDIMREELKASKKRELEAQKARREMVAELSHDLKTPVATIGATCEVLDMKYQMKAKSGSPEEIKEAQDSLEKIGYIKDKTDIINELVDNVLHASEDEIDEISIIPKEVESSVIEGFFSSSKDYANIIFDDHIPQCLVLIDKLRMKQVIDNVISNSIKYAGTDIHVSFSDIEEQKNRYVKIRIKDSGPGVNEEDLPLITGKFVRGKNAEDKSGYGLGLYLVNYYMEKQNGGINYYNDNGFVIELLVRKAG